MGSEMCIRDRHTRCSDRHSSHFFKRCLDKGRLVRPSFSSAGIYGHYFYLGQWDTLCPLVRHSFSYRDLSAFNNKGSYTKDYCEQTNGGRFNTMEGSLAFSGCTIFRYPSFIRFTISAWNRALNQVSKSAYRSLKIFFWTLPIVFLGNSST